MTTRTVILGSDRIQARIADLGHEISTDYKDGKLVLMGVLNGAFMFLADLARAVDLPMEIDFIRVASYGESASSSGTIKLLKEAELDLTGKDVLLVEDIVDTGITVNWLRNYFEQHQAGSVKICALIDKKERREADVHIDYTGFTIMDKGFLIGYGLDYAGLYRNLPEVYCLEP